jgi:hypothetical protein
MALSVHLAVDNYRYVITKINHVTESMLQSIETDGVRQIIHQVPKCIGLLYDNTLCVGDCIHWQLTIDIDNDDQFILQLTI